MKKWMLKSTIASLVLAAGAPAFANLVQVPGDQVTGTGLGAVSTLVTVKDNGVPGTGNGNNVESGCVTYDATVTDFNKPKFDCQAGLEGLDNQATNNVYDASTISGLINAGHLAVVVNVSEGNPNDPDHTVILTDLYLSLYNTSNNTRTLFRFMDGPVELSDSGGIGQSGDNLFVLDAAQVLQAFSACPTLSECVIGGGMQFAEGTTSATQETMYVASVKNVQVPEPVSLALFGAGLLGLRAARRARR